METLVIASLLAHIITLSKHDTESEALLWLENDVAMCLRYQNGDFDLGNSSAIPIRFRYNQICDAYGLVVSNVSLTLAAIFTKHTCALN